LKQNRMIRGGARSKLLRAGSEADACNSRLAVESCAALRSSSWRGTQLACALPRLAGTIHRPEARRDPCDRVGVRSATNKMTYQSGASITMSKKTKHMIADTSGSIRSAVRSRIFRTRMYRLL